MNIFISIAGEGTRFKDEGYSLPKSLIQCKGKPMIKLLLESLKLIDDDLLVVTYIHNLDLYRIRDIVNKIVKNVLFVCVPFQTRNIVQALQYTLSFIPKERWDRKSVTLDCDNFYTSDVLSVVRSSPNNSILYKVDKNIKPIYSYIELNDNKIINIKEKEKISDNANIGVYKFGDLYTIKKYSDIIESRKNDREMYVSHIYNEMLKDQLDVFGVKFEDVVCIGTPLQLKLFSLSNSSEVIRFCFDLDNTLVTLPRIDGDYTTVEPIPETINFLRFIKKLGHTVIIHTARRMKTHNGDVGKVVADIGRITFDTLEKFDIPYDELYFGKPYADFYIDDKSISSFSNLERETGFYNLSFKERSFNTIKYEENVIVKSSGNSKILGEIHWYSNIPLNITYLFPKLFGYNEHELTYSIEKIKGIPLSHMFVNLCLSKETLISLLNTMSKIHSSSVVTDKINPYDVYLPKLRERYSSFDYSKFPQSEEIYDELVSFYSKYELESCAETMVVHGDPVFSNILIDNLSQFKFVDMRGIQGNKLTIYGDVFYDYAKIYQSLLGYEFVLYEKRLEYIYMKTMVDIFKEYFVSKFSQKKWNYLQYLTLGLYFTLIPLHDEKFQSLLYEHTLRVFETMKF